jgi:hypothetical protein
MAYRETVKECSNGYHPIVTRLEMIKADELAKAGTSMKQPATRIPLHTVKAHLAASVKEKMRKEWTTVGRGKMWPKAQAKEKKRSVATAQLQLAMILDVMLNASTLPKIINAHCAIKSNPTDLISSDVVQLKVILTTFKHNYPCRRRKRIFIGSCA